MLWQILWMLLRLSSTKEGNDFSRTNPIEDKTAFQNRHAAFPSWTKQVFALCTCGFEECCSEYQYSLEHTGEVDDMLVGSSTLWLFTTQTVWSLHKLPRPLESSTRKNLSWYSWEIVNRGVKQQRASMRHIIAYQYNDSCCCSWMKLCVHVCSKWRAISENSSGFPCRDPIRLSSFSDIALFQ